MSTERNKFLVDSFVKSMEKSCREMRCYHWIVEMMLKNSI